MPADHHPTSLRFQFTRCDWLRISGAAAFGLPLLSSTTSAAAMEVAYQVRRSFSPDDLGTTLFSALCIPTTSELRDQFGRPMPSCNGRVIEELYGS